MPYQIIFYEKSNGKSDVWDFLEQLRHKSMKSKDARIQYKQVLLSIELLQQNGNVLPDTIAKHITEDIWELRPGHNRIFYFCCDGNNYILLHHFRKKSQKTPQLEIEKPKLNERIIYQERSLYNIMKTWNNYKEYVTAEDPENQQMIASMEEQAAIISEIIKQRNALGLSQRDLASMCNIPQSSIARMESLQTTPSLSTLLKIMKPLGLHLTVTKQLPLRN